MKLLCVGGGHNHVLVNDKYLAHIVCVYSLRTNLV